MSFSPANFGRYASQTEHSMDELTGINDRVQKSTIPPLMSLSITPPPSSPVMTTNTQQNFIMPTSVIKENIEPIPFPQHVPGPIQRPNKLSVFQTLPFLHDSNGSPDTPEVLVQINHLVDHQNSITGISSNASNLTSSSTMINDIPTPNVSWTPFSPPEWSTKYESSWPLTPPQNPFAQRQIPKDESNLWSEIPINASWLKFSPTSPSNRQENEANIPFWNPAETQPNSSTPWWPKTPSDENNNDQSRWEFAR